jgi:peptidoglycan hydrolase-like protein with peptidoglycan-binding domain
MRSRRVLAGLLGIVALGAVTAGVVALTPGGESATAADAGPAATEAVTRGDLVDTETVTGTLRYANPRQLVSELAGKATAVPHVGAAVRRGQPLYRVDGKAVTLMLGRVPLFRTLETGVADGADVLQLERNLRALGHGELLTVDRHFSAATAAAVAAWQSAAGLEVTGSVTPAEVVFLPRAVRVQSAAVVVGNPVRTGEPILTVADDRRIVSIPLEVGRQQLARRGAKVSVRLPNQRTVPGRITAVAKVAEAPEGGEGTATVDVEVTLDAPRAAGRLDRAPVSVALRSRTREAVLSVPVEALLALREGGYAVELVEGQGTRLVPVELGLFAAGRVEITDGDLREGMRVGVPAP